MDQIRKGRQLHHVEADKESVTSNTSSDDPRDALMNQIRQGVGLRRVETNKGRPDRNSNPAEAGGLAGALAKALLERSKAINRTDDESEDTDSDDDDWD